MQAQQGREEAQASHPNSTFHIATEFKYLQLS